MVFPAPPNIPGSLETTSQPVTVLQSTNIQWDLELLVLFFWEQMWCCQAQLFSENIFSTAEEAETVGFGLLREVEIGFQSL